LLDLSKLKLYMFNIIISIINIIKFIIINIIINKFEKDIITIKKNHTFDLKGKVKSIASLT
jgi:hypothetical protein